ncbi:hypothetical protein Micbo1qcDRAFT_181294 [Microdochium bolleyi]|uniref:Secreted protein n=1 Tax=Microdochium bolleyi TaxID=196109 RepID=A0A136IJS0_9PEZI|nr:hypothetical protein Micbo1qcDRAFT_181294 [Microdochium bolleyi]
MAWFSAALLRQSLLTRCWHLIVPCLYAQKTPSARKTSLPYAGATDPANDEMSIGETDDPGHEDAMIGRHDQKAAGAMQARDAGALQAQGQNMQPQKVRFGSVSYGRKRGERTLI